MKKIVFVTGTRADFGKLKSIIKALQKSRLFEIHIFATGMHMNHRYGYTIHEIEKSRLPNIYKFINHSDNDHLDTILSSTIHGFGNYIRSINPDMIVIHGDRVEALAGAFVGSFNNILVSHIEGGEVSGTIDDHIRHSISKMSHLHFVANKEANRRLIQMGENKENIFIIGSPDIDIMNSKSLPTLAKARERYRVPYNNYALLIHHTVTTEIDKLKEQTRTLVNTLVESKSNYITIYPNNDPGTDIIQDVYNNKILKNKYFKIFPSIRFEYFLTFLKNARFVIGNSSAGVREAPFYGIPTINIGTRQNNRTNSVSNQSIITCDYDKENILKNINKFSNKIIRFRPSKFWGIGDSCNNFLKIIKQKDIWDRNIQKKFQDVKII